MHGLRSFVVNLGSVARGMRVYVRITLCLWQRLQDAARPGRPVPSKTDRN